MTTHDRPRFASLRGTPEGIGAVMAERPQKYMMLMTFAQEILREQSHLTPADREVIAAYTSKLNGCEYCCGSHTEFAKSLGAGADDLAVVEHGNIDAHRLAALLAYVRKLTLAPSTICEADKQAVHSAGFSEEELKDAIAVCAAFNLFNRIVEGHGVAPHADYTMAAKMINTHGYDRRR
ncbi:MAG: carboxymuconolactone decarboxylase family protein [Ilumatobacteraceae bacterium]|jgi:uncharacterized peroxidase-related enzyme